MATGLSGIASRVSIVTMYSPYALSSCLIPQPLDITQIDRKNPADHNIMGEPPIFTSCRFISVFLFPEANKASSSGCFSCLFDAKMLRPNTGLVATHRTIGERGEISTLYQLYGSSKDRPCDNSDDSRAMLILGSDPYLTSKSLNASHQKN